MLIYYYYLSNFQYNEHFQRNYNDLFRPCKYFINININKFK